MGELIGLLAGALTTISFVPQLVHTVRTKDTKSISLGMYIIFCTGVLFWTIYGFFIQALPVIGWNLVTLVLASCILFFKIKQVLHDKRESSPIKPL